MGLVGFTQKNRVSAKLILFFRVFFFPTSLIFETRFHYTQLRIWYDLYS